MKAWIYTKDGNSEFFEVYGKFGMEMKKDESPGRYDDRQGGFASDEGSAPPIDRYGPQPEKDKSPGRYGDQLACGWGVK